MLNGKRHIAILMATRPNIIKVAALERAADLYEDIRTTLIHTGQHYDKALREDIFASTGLRSPDYYLNISGPNSEKNQKEMDLKLGKILLKENPDIVIVVGDVNATLWAANTAYNLSFPIAHIEAGLRSFDHTMPEERNRVIVDQLSTYHFVTEKDALDNLLAEGFGNEHIYYVGNTMIDTLTYVVNENKFEKSIGSDHAIFTAHRPGNVDKKENLQDLLDILEIAIRKISVLWFMHPRTLKRLHQHGLWARVEELNKSNSLTLKKPANYVDFTRSLYNAKLVITDSGGLQEEACSLGIPCMTIRPNTERPSTILSGSNTLTPIDNKLHFENVLKDNIQSVKKVTLPKKWDGKSAKRIMIELKKIATNLSTNRLARKVDSKS